MTASREVKPGMTYNPDTGSYTVRDVAGAYVGSTVHSDTAESWWLTGIGSGYAAGQAPPARCLTSGGDNGVHVIVRRESGFVAGWNLADVAEAERFALECNASAPADPARIVTWDDSVWDSLLGSKS